MGAARNASCVPSDDHAGEQHGQIDLPDQQVGRELVNGRAALQRDFAHRDRSLAKCGGGRSEKRDGGEQGDLHCASRVPAASVGLKAADRILTS